MCVSIVKRILIFVSASSVKAERTTLQGAKQKLYRQRYVYPRLTEITDRLLLVREELASMRKELDYLTYYSCHLSNSCYYPYTVGLLFSKKTKYDIIHNT